MIVATSAAAMAHALWHVHRPHITTLPFHGPAAGLRLTRLFGAASGVRSNIPVTSASARRESLSDGGVPGREPTQPIAPYHAINYSAEVSLQEYSVPVYLYCY